MDRILTQNWFKFDNPKAFENPESQNRAPWFSCFDFYGTQEDRHPR